MRLIDADELILHLNDFMMQESPIDVQDIESINVCAVIKECIKAVEEQPIAYDVDKVVEELEEYSNADEAERHGTIPVIELDDAIDIVKRGGVDDD